MQPTARLLSEFLKKGFGATGRGLSVVPLGKGSHGQGFRVSFRVGGAARKVIVKLLKAGDGLGHDYPSDRAAVFLQAFGAYGRLPRHVKAVDVLALGKGGRLFSVAGGREYYLVMEEAEGRSYFDDLRAMAAKSALDAADRARVAGMASYLAGIHARKKDLPRLYHRKIRDTIGHGECLMGVLDTYDGAGFTNHAEMAAIEKACIGWRYRMKPLSGRLCVTHGDFHPGNILFASGRRFRLLDRSRGEYGEAADDLTALTINYVLFSLINFGRMAGAYKEAAEMFYGEYIRLTGDEAVLDVAAPFYAFRGAVVANPLFYPDVSDEVRGKIFGFVHGVLRARSFAPGRINAYIRNGLRYRERFF